MSTDRRIDLEIGLSQGGAGWDARKGGDGERRRDADDADSQAFARVLKGVADESQEAARMSAPLTPFGLFGAAPPQASAEPQLSSELEESLRLAARRLLVSDQDGSGRREVRVELDEGFMEGVSVSVFEEGGALVVLFRCATQSAQRRVSALAQGLADGLAASLRRLVRISLLDHDDVDVHPGQWMADGSAL